MRNEGGVRRCLFRYTASDHKRMLTVDYVLGPTVPLYIQANLDINAQGAEESHDTVVLSQVNTDNDGQAPVVTSGHAPFFEFGQLQSGIMSEKLSTLAHDEQAVLANVVQAGLAN